MTEPLNHLQDKLADQLATLSRDLYKERHARQDDFQMLRQSLRDLNAVYQALHNDLARLVRHLTWTERHFTAFVEATNVWARHQRHVRGDPEDQESNNEERSDNV